MGRIAQRNKKYDNFYSRQLWFREHEITTNISLKITKITNDNPLKKQNNMATWKVFKILTIYLFSFQSVPITTPESTTDIDNLGIIGKSRNMP